VITIDTQIHGYRQGHQLLASTAGLPKTDQSTIDQLSDVAGPLRPGEVFAPYLSAYALPSGHHYVLARTWQDLTVPRAGCVRTLSLLIPTSAWASAPGLKSFLEPLDPETLPSTAEALTLSEPSPASLPPAPAFQASELLEALFLEEAKPVAIFDAPSPELIALRLLTALWPSLRSRFALSTFALSPRKIEGRSFDLVFAPKDARPKFADWPGRRIDARAGQGARHRWTSAIVDRVFNEPVPRLLAERELRLIGTDESSTTAALRIALLWDELLAKLDRSPSAALGLLDIANTKMQGDPEAVLALLPALADAAQRAVTSLPPSEAWDFIGAMARKTHGTRLAPAVRSVAAAAGLLARTSPSGAVALLDQLDPQGALQSLVPQIAEALDELFGGSAEQAIAKALPETLARLIGANEALTRKIVAKPSLIERLARILPELAPTTFDSVREALLPLLIDDPQIAAARPLLASLDADGLMAEVRHLHEVNALEAATFVIPLVARARDLQAVSRLRDVLVATPAAGGRDRLLRATLAPTVEDVIWLLEEARLHETTVDAFLADLLLAADKDQFRGLLTHGSLAQTILGTLSTDASDVLLRALDEVELPLAVHVATTVRLLPTSPDPQRVALARKALDRCLRDHFANHEVETVSMLLGVVGQALDGGWAAWRGLERGVAGPVVNRNLVAFNNTSAAARMRIVGAVDSVAQALAGRHAVELDEEAGDACARLFWDAQSTDADGLLRAAGRLLPLLLRSVRAPVSGMVAATFPAIYRELAKEEDVPDLFKFVPFLDWDRCKAARRELVDAFLASTVWKPGDLALTACRASDVGNIFRRIAKAYEGETYTDRIAADLSRLPAPCREQTENAIAKIRSEWSGRSNWRD